MGLRFKRFRVEGFGVKGFSILALLIDRRDPQTFRYLFTLSEDQSSSSQSGPSEFAAA